MRVFDLVTAMEQIAPLRYAEPWDRVGLLVGRPEHDLSGPVLLTIDLTERVVGEARAMNASAIVAYHAPIWEPVRRITSETSRGRILLGCIEGCISVYTPHTALDAAEGGVTDWLCEGLASDDPEPGKIAGDCRALTPVWEEAGHRVKVVTFVPAEHLESVRSALATAGAGRIGEYEVCSFSVEGEGTFLGSEKSRPVIGKAGRLEHVREHRLEMICPRSAAALAVETLRKFHPYEEPAIDVYELEGLPQRSVGAGRRLVLDQGVTPAHLARRLQRFLGHARIQIASPAPEVPVSHLGVVPGAGESLLEIARSEGCEAFITGEMRHHSVIEALHAGLGVILCGHTNTERGYLGRLRERLGGSLRGVDIRLSKADADPLEEFSAD